MLPPFKSFPIYITIWYSQYNKNNINTFINLQTYKYGYKVLFRNKSDFTLKGFLC